ncbi:hypothetical protein CYMTET_51857 [Cymbomonas tetramitiformis]|uniref:Uncharacterized protein n=1 Tax=Cymbomonas tetramitiformis TaxID=36881 RepID=A0AAE0BK74_9CHLO|nr:hypothetical protein CYMTET_51857 [Cymbomonas tetramitiformis]
MERILQLQKAGTNVRKAEVVRAVVQARTMNHAYKTPHKGWYLKPGKAALHCRSHSTCKPTGAHPEEETVHHECGALLSTAARSLGAALVTLALNWSLVQSASAFDDTGLIDGHLRSCRPKTSCVSTSAGQSPSQYIAPWDHPGYNAEQAYSRLRSQVLSQGGEIMEEDIGRYIQARIPFGKEEDIIEFLLIDGDDGVICLRDISQVALPDPPFCLGKGCINGSRNRDRVNQLRDTVGFLSFETDEDKEWVPLLLH